MATVHDVAAYILKRQGTMTAMKLHKLLYYSQAWSLVWDEECLFKARIEAWANGPVVPSIYQKHRGKFKIHNWPGDVTTLTSLQQETVDAVLKYYGGRSSQWLSDLTHQEDPWRDARKGLSPTQRSHQVIPEAAMTEYYESLG